MIPNKQCGLVSVLFAVAAVLLSLGSVQAQTVERDAENATAIRDLTVNGVSYDVKFCSATAESLYGNPPVFDFPDSATALEATLAISDTLNAEGGIETVGTVGDPECPGTPTVRSSLRVGWGTNVEEIGGEFLEFTVVWEADAGSATPGAAQDFWIVPTNSGTGAPESEQFPPDTDGMYALFTQTGTVGPVDLTGTVEDAGGTPLCSLVLASGQFMFSCNPNGPFSLLDLPTETDGSVMRQVYVDGFFPNVETLQGSTDETVVMTRAGTCPDYNSFPEPGVFPDSAGKRIDISGTVLLQNTQTPVCAMVLANGQFAFTCDGSGSYAGNIPLDANGQYKLQVYAQGFAPTIQAFDEFSPINEVRMARAAECQ